MDIDQTLSMPIDIEFAVTDKCDSGRGPQLTRKEIQKVGPSR